MNAKKSRSKNVNAAAYEGTRAPASATPATGMTADIVRDARALLDRHGATPRERALLDLPVLPEALTRACALRGHRVEIWARALACAAGVDLKAAYHSSPGLLAGAIVDFADLAARFDCREAA